VERAATAEEARVAAGELRELVVETLQSVRRLAVELRPSALDDFGLEPALRRLGQAVREGGTLDVQVETRLGAERLLPEVETAVYRIAQEGLNNVIKHAAAQRVSIVVTRAAERLMVVIEDDGAGFDAGAVPGEGLGLLGMRERVQLLDGSLTIDAQPGLGTTLVVELPLV
jgi:signal transduction histidine kinase